MNDNLISRSFCPKSKTYGMKLGDQFDINLPVFEQAAPKPWKEEKMTQIKQSLSD